LLAHSLHSPFAIALLLFPLSFATMVSLPFSYALFAAFLTPTFVLASLSHSGDWQLAIARILNTIGGALVAAVAMHSLWPQWEHERFHEELSKGVSAAARYLETLLHGWHSAGGITAVEVARARRSTGMANNAAEESLDSLINEPRSNAAVAEAGLAFVTYMRRFDQSITTLHATPPTEQMRSPETEERLRRTLGVLQRIQVCLASGPSDSSCFEVPALLESGTPTQASQTDTQLDVLERQVRVMAQSLARMNRAWPR
jgi:uncharacterized membrane protein YccC